MRGVLVLLVASLFLLVSGHAADAQGSVVECRSFKPRLDHRYWRWRMVDGRRCWYPGHKTLSKSALRWPEHAEGGRPLQNPLRSMPHDPLRGILRSYGPE
jgi:hypothetical protein